MLKELKQLDTFQGSSFSFSTVEKFDVIGKIRYLSKKKAIHDDDTPVKILKANAYFFAKYICIFYNNTITNSNPVDTERKLNVHKTFNLHSVYTEKFPSYLKMVNVTPVFRKGSKNKKENFRPVRIFTALQKIFQKLMSKQLSTFFENIRAKFLCGFRKGYSM